MTSTYFKSTDWNSYIGQGSCHHPFWLKGVPKSQFIRLRRKCTIYDDYIKQSMVLRARFIEKGYSADELDGIISDVGTIVPPFWMAR